MAQATHHQVATPPDRLEGFRGRFCVFPLRLERLGLRYWYVLVGFPVPAIFLLTLATAYLDTGLTLAKEVAPENNVPAEVFTPGGSALHRVCLYVTYLFLNDVGFILAALGLLFAGYAFVVWQRKIRELFQFLPEAALAGPAGGKEEFDERFLDYLGEYKKRLTSRQRFLIVVPVTALALLPAFTSGGLLRAPGGPAEHLWYLSESIRWFFAVLVWAYCVAACGWVIAVTAAFIKKLPARFEFKLNPGHPDKCGGLEPVGEFCLLLVTPILIAILYLSLFGIVTRAVDTPAMRYMAPAHDIVVVLDNVALFALAIPLAAFVFFNTLWSFHKMMLRKRREYEDEYSLLVRECLDGMKSAIERDDVDAAKVSSEKLDVVSKMHPDNIGFPVWPFNRQILVRFITPQALSILGTVFPFIKRFFVA